MTDRVWIEIPAVGTGTADDPVRAKHPVEGKALLMHQNGKVYVLFRDERSREDALRQSDCRRLTPAEAHALEEGLPFPIPGHLFSDIQASRTRAIGLGDLVSLVTRRAGIAECHSCQQRKRSLNRIVVWGWWRR